MEKSEPQMARRFSNLPLEDNIIVKSQKGIEILQGVALPAEAREISMNEAHSQKLFVLA